MGDVNLITKKSGIGYVPSLIMLIIVIIITVGLYIYNDYLVGEIKKVQKNITSIENNIKEVEKEDSLQVYSLMKLNKSYLDEYELMNNVTKYINHMNDIESKYDVKFTDFNLLKGEIATNVSIISDNKGIAYQKARVFIKGYRVDAEALFDLNFINSLEGMDNIKFSIIFKIK